MLNIIMFNSQTCSLYFYNNYKYVTIWIFPPNLQLLYLDAFLYNHFLKEIVLKAYRILTKYVFLEHYIIPWISLLVKSVSLCEMELCSFSMT